MTLLAILGALFVVALGFAVYAVFSFDFEAEEKKIREDDYRESLIVRGSNIWRQ